jgi:hypothetical protein
MSSGEGAVGFLKAKTYKGYDAIVDYCTFHHLDYFSDVHSKKVFLFTRDSALKVDVFLKNTNTKALFVNIIKD